MDDPRYRSFVVRLWRTPEGEVWRGEVESIQSGAIATIASLEELVGVIRRSLVGNNEQSAAPDGDKRGRG